MIDLAAIQKALGEQGLDGWLLYDLRGSNPIARAVIGFDERQIGTRRWFYLIPRAGEPVAIRRTRSRGRPASRCCTGPGASSSPP